MIFLYIVLIFLFLFFHFFIWLLLYIFIILILTLFRKLCIALNINDIKKIKEDFHVPEKYLSLINKDCKITSTSIAIPNKKFYGFVQTISPRISPTSRSISLRGTFCIFEDGKRVKRKEIEIDQCLSGFLEIISGLKAGDSVVAEGVVKISDKDIVEINSRPENSNNVAIDAS